MNRSKLIWWAFAGFWLVSFAVALGPYSIRKNIQQSRLNQLVPLGYNMYSPIALTKYRVEYDFFDRQNRLILSTNSVDFLNSHSNVFEQHKLNMAYFKRLFQLDDAFLKSRYEKKYDTANYISFDKRVRDSRSLTNILENLQKFGRYFADNHLSRENVGGFELRLYRLPIRPEYLQELPNDFTYYLEDSLILSKKGPL